MRDPSFTALLFTGIIEKIGFYSIVYSIQVAPIAIQLIVRKKSPREKESIHAKRINDR